MDHSTRLIFDPFHSKKPIFQIEKVEFLRDIRNEKDKDVKAALMTMLSGKVRRDQRSLIKSKIEIKDQSLDERSRYNAGKGWSSLPSTHAQYNLVQMGSVGFKFIKNDALLQPLSSLIPHSTKLGRHLF